VVSTSPESANTDDHTIAPPDCRSSARWTRCGGCPKDPWRCFETFPLNADDMEAPEKDPGWCWRLCNFFSFPITRVLTILAAGVVLFLGYHRVCEMSEEGVVQQPASSLVAFSYVDLGVDLPRQRCSST